MKTPSTPIVYPEETVLERFVRRKWLGLIFYDVVISTTSLGYNLRIAADENPDHVYVNCVLYKPDHENH